MEGLDTFAQGRRVLALEVRLAVKAGEAEFAPCPVPAELSFEAIFEAITFCEGLLK